MTTQNLLVALGIFVLGSIAVAVFLFFKILEERGIKYDALTE